MSLDSGVYAFFILHLVKYPGVLNVGGLALLRLGHSKRISQNMYVALAQTVFPALLLAACSPFQVSDQAISVAKSDLRRAEFENWQMLEGKWYGSEPVLGGGFREQIIERFDDGTFRTIFRIHRTDSKFSENIETGQWGISGDIYFSIFRGQIFGSHFISADTGNPYNYDAYHAIHLSKEKFEFEHVTSGKRYVTWKVSPDFTFGSN